MATFKVSAGNSSVIVQHTHAETAKYIGVAYLMLTRADIIMKVNTPPTVEEATYDQVRTQQTFGATDILTEAKFLQAIQKMNRDPIYEVLAMPRLKPNTEVM